jgi:hypothetical protein
VLEEIGEYDASIKYDEQPLEFKELFEDNADLKKVIEADLLKVMGVENVRETLQMTFHKVAVRAQRRGS